jgi:hypothetical protein
MTVMPKPKVIKRRHRGTPEELAEDIRRIEEAEDGACVLIHSLPEKVYRELARRKSELT